MLELILSVAVVAMIVIYIYSILIKSNKEDLYSELSRSNKELLRIATDQTSVSKDLIKFIDKNINERVVYADTQLGYSNDHKFDKEEERDLSEEVDLFTVPEDMTPEDLAKTMEGNKEEGKK